MSLSPSATIWISAGLGLGASLGERFSAEHEPRSLRTLLRLLLPEARPPLKGIPQSVQILRVTSEKVFEVVGILEQFTDKVGVLFVHREPRACGIKNDLIALIPVSPKGSQCSHESTTSSHTDQLLRHGTFIPIHCVPLFTILRREKFVPREAPILS